MMIPEFWLEPTAFIFTVVMIAAMTGGTPVMIITDDGVHYGIER